MNDLVEHQDVAQFSFLQTHHEIAMFYPWPNPYTPQVTTLGTTSRKIQRIKPNHASYCREMSFLYHESSIFSNDEELGQI